MTKTTETPQVASARPRRQPLGQRNRLDVKNKEAGYIYRIVNDDGDRINELAEQGYEIVPKDKAGVIGSKRVDTASAPGSTSYISVGQGTKAVLMRIREDWNKEDQAFKQRQIDEIEQTMKSEKADYGSIKQESKFRE
jgi:hypothetical protein